MALHGRPSISTRQWSLGPCSPPFVACTRTATNTFQVRAGQQHEGRRASARPHDEERCHQARAYVAGTGRQGKERKVRPVRRLLVSTRQALPPAGRHEEAPYWSHLTLFALPARPGHVRARLVTTFLVVRTR